MTTAATTNGGVAPDLAVRIDALVKSYPGRGEVLKGVSLEVPRSKIVSIIGQSGGGKTTLLRCVNLLERPDRAEMQIGGEKVFSGDRLVCPRPRSCARRSEWCSSASTCSRI